MFEYACGSFQGFLLFGVEVKCEDRLNATLSNDTGRAEGNIVHPILPGQ